MQVARNHRGRCCGARLQVVYDAILSGQLVIIIIGQSDTQQTHTKTHNRCALCWSSFGGDCVMAAHGNGGVALQPFTCTQMSRGRHTHNYRRGISQCVESSEWRWVVISFVHSYVVTILWMFCLCSLCCYWHELVHIDCMIIHPDEFFFCHVRISSNDRVSV